MAKKKSTAKNKPRIGRPPTGQMPPFQVRMDPEEHAACKKKAASQGKTLSDVIRDYLRWWLNQ